MKLGANQVRDRKTGRVRSKSMKAVRAGRKAARGRTRMESSTTKNKIRKGLARVFRTGKTKSGRRAVI